MKYIKVENNKIYIQIVSFLLIYELIINFDIVGFSRFLIFSMRMRKLWMKKNTLKNEKPTKSPKFPPMLLMNDDKLMSLDVVDTLMSVVE